MPVHFCGRCKAVRTMYLALSRVRLQDTASEITTKTYYCTCCGALELDQEESDREASSRSPRKRNPVVSSHKAPDAFPASAPAPRFLVLLLLAFFLSVSCSTVPITKRRQLSLIPSETILPMSSDQYRDFLSKNKVVENTPAAETVKRVGVRIQQAVERYFAANNMSSRLKGYAWEFNLVENKSINAWCMPGGKVVVYTGIFPVAGDEAGLSVVMGHEIAHAVANHGDERMSQGLIAEMGGIALSAALSQKPEQTRNLFMAAYGAGAQVGVLLPFSRVQESEADRLGLIFMSMAGYDPHAAVPFWERMSGAHEGPAPPELLSTHPADMKRIENLKKLIPEALQYYKK